MGDECCEINQRPSIKSRFCDNLEFINDDLNCTGLGHFEWVPHNVTREHRTYHPLTPEKKQKQTHNPRYRAGVVWILLVCHLLCEASKKVRRHRLGVSNCRKKSQLQPASFNNRRGEGGFFCKKTYQSSNPKCRCYKGMAMAPGFIASWTTCALLCDMSWLCKFLLGTIRKWKLNCWLDVLFLPTWHG